MPGWVGPAHMLWRKIRSTVLLLVAVLLPSRCCSSEIVVIIVLGRSTWLRPIYTCNCVELDRSRKELSYVFTGLRTEQFFIVMIMGAIMTADTEKYHRFFSLSGMMTAYDHLLLLQHCQLLCHLSMRFLFELWFQYLSNISRIDLEMTTFQQWIIGRLGSD